MIYKEKHYFLKFSKLIYFLYFLFFNISLPVNAASVSQQVSQQMSQMGCDVLVEGLIQEGDAIKLEQALIAQDKKIAGQNYNGPLIGARPGSHKRVCFDSPGGSFIEGLALGKVLLKARKGSAIGKNMVCESACALAFMGGSGVSGGIEGSDDHDRALHPDGRLGFHAPSINVPNQTYEKSIVEKAYRVAIKSIAAIVETKNELNIDYVPGTDQRVSFKYDIPDSLLLFMLSTPPDQMSYVETIKDASRWSIRIEPINMNSAPEPIEAFANACDNQSYYWMEIRPSLYESPPFLAGYNGQAAGFRATGSSGLSNWNMRNEIGVRLTSDLGEYWYDCDVEIFDGLSFGAIENLSEPIGGATGTGARRFFYPFQLFSPTTKINSLSPRKLSLADYANTQSRLISYISSLNEGASLACMIEDPTSKIVNVQNFTNLRQQAGLNGRVIGEVGLGEQVRIVSPGRYLRYDRCAAACEGSSQNAIKQCIDNNDVWIEVEYNGQRGFLSRKFLE